MVLIVLDSPEGRGDCWRVVPSSSVEKDSLFVLELLVLGVGGEGNGGSGVLQFICSFPNFLFYLF
jgi:hypothetical protein